jgi:hypothetical protein
MAPPLIDESDHAPLWPVGLVVLTVEEVKKRCVEAFPESSTRAELMGQFEGVWARLVACKVPGELWLDGSFVTDKLNPLDIDFVLIVDALQYDKSPDLRRACDALCEPEDGWPPPLCDTSVIYRDPPEVQSNLHEVLRYWERKFGSAPTKGLPKGIVVVQLELEEEAGS